MPGLELASSEYPVSEVRPLTTQALNNCGHPRDLFKYSQHEFLPRRAINARDKFIKLARWGAFASLRSESFGRFMTLLPLVESQINGQLYKM